MKKVLSFVLVLSMILGSFGMAFAATDVDGSEYKDALTVLLGLGVIEGYEDGTVKPEKVVTRAEAATLIIKAMGLADYAVAKTTKFTDMDQAAWAVPFVAYAESLKIVAGKTETTFAPNEPVTSDQMIAMLVQAVGYKAEYLNGGFPGAFVNVAKGQGMLDGVKSGSEGCTRGEVAQLIYNTLDVPFVQYDKNGDITYLNDDMAGRLYADKTVSKAAIVLGTEDTKIDLKPYLGMKADIVKDEGEVVAIDNIKSVYVEGKLSADAKTFELADKTEYKFNLSESKTSADAVTYFYNGEYTTGATASLAAVTGQSLKLAVKLDGNYIKELHSISKWDATGTVKWEDAYAEEVADEDAPKLSGAAFALTTKDEIDTTKFVLEGVASLDKIEKDAIVTYYVANNKIVKIAVSTAVVEGKITEVTKDGDYVINGKAYDAAEGKELVDVTGIGLGKEGTFRLNAAGDIAHFKATASDKNFAVVVKNASTEALGYDSDDSYKIKLQTEDGKKVVFDVTKDCFNTQASAAAITPEALVVYTLNKDGKVNDITTATLSAAELQFKLTAKGYMNGVKVAKDAVVFDYLNAEDGFAVTDLSVIAVDTTLSATRYVVDETTKEIVAIVTRDNNNDNGVYGMVTGYATVKNADDETVFRVDMLVDGAAKSALTTKTAYGNAVSTSAIATTSLCAFDFVDGEMTTAVAVRATTSGSVNKAQDGNISFDGENFVQGAEKVVVYVVDAKAETVEVSSFAKIVKNTKVELYDVDADEAGFDIVIIRK